MPKEDLYLSMLRVGKDNLTDGLTNQELIDLLKEKGFANMSIYNTVVTHYFYKVFFSKEDDKGYPPNHSVRFYLRPECYMQLLEYDSMLNSKREAKTARIYAIIAIVLTLAAIVIDLIK